jgi:hypothetical protein
MDAVDRTRILALIQYVRSRMAAGMEISSDDLARRFRLDQFVVERLLERERGRPEREAAGEGGPRGPTREMAPASGSEAAE